MTFLAAIRNGYAKYATFSGRARRSEFWWWTLFEYVTRGILGAIYSMVMLSMLAPAMVDGISDDAAVTIVMGAIFNPAYFVLLAWSLSILLPTIAVGVRRLHDTGRSGWFYLLFFIPAVGTILMIVFTVQESEAKKNAWGAAPAAN